MSSLQKLKAYFGMIPADEVDDYGYEYDDDRYGRYDQDDYYSEPESIGAYAERRGGSTRGDYRDYPRESDERPEPASARATARRAWAGAGQAPVRGSLAVEPEAEPVTRLRPMAEPAPAQRTDNALSSITTLHLRSYNEARTIGEPYRDGIPVIMDLTEMEDADAKRLVDFAAGLAFALRGAMDKITTKVFLLSPPNVHVTAEDKRRMAEGGFFARR